MPTIGAMPRLVRLDAPGVLLWVLALGRKTIESGESHQLREPSIQYVAHFGVKKSDIGSKNTYPSHCFSHIGLVKWLSP